MIGVEEDVKLPVHVAVFFLAMLVGAGGTTWLVAATGAFDSMIPGCGYPHRPVSGQVSQSFGFDEQAEAAGFEERWMRRGWVVSAEATGSGWRLTASCGDDLDGGGV